MLNRHAPIARRSALASTGRLPARRATPRRSERVCNLSYLAWVNTLTCAASGINGHVCEGPIEADHVGPRPLGRKADDTTCIALCLLAHRQRTDHAGPFRAFTRDDMLRWVAEQLAITTAAWAAHTAGSAGTESL